MINVSASRDFERIKNKGLISVIVTGSLIDFIAWLFVGKLDCVTGTMFWKSGMENKKNKNDIQVLITERVDINCFVALTHWGRVTHICVGKLTIIGSDNGLSSGRRQAIIWINAGILLIGSLGTKFNELLIEIQTFSFKEMHFKMSSAKWRPFCLGLNVLNPLLIIEIYNTGHAITVMSYWTS